MATYYYQKATDLKNVVASCNLAYFYEMGIGVEQDYQKAYELYLKGAKAGFPRAIDVYKRQIQDNPSVLKRPIMIDERRFQVGYNAEEIRVFIPRELRKLAECPSKDNCPQFIGNPCNMKEAYFKSK